MNTNKDISNFISTNKPVGIKTVCVLNNTSINQKTTDLRQCISDTELLSVFASPPVNWKIDCYRVDWTGLPNILDTQIFETNSEYDALNRVTKMIYPEDVENERKELTPEYNRAGALQRVTMDGNDYVKHIAYNAKGQRLLIAYGNDTMTRYCYKNTTFRLQRIRSEKYAYSEDENKRIYTPQSGTNKQDDGFNFDLVGNILKILHRVNDCGINGSILGSNALDRNFEYDPLYRVTSANGRESNTQNQNDYLYCDAPAPGTPNANNVRVYTRKYTFDKLGNIQQLKQLGTNGFTRNFTYNVGGNTLQKVETPTPTLIEDFTYDVCGNQLTAGTTRNYVWNAGNQLITYYNKVGSADPTIFAQYDYSGMDRVSKLVKTGSSATPIYERTIYIDGIFEYHILENGTTYEKNYIHIMDDKSRIAMVRVGTAFPDDITDAITYNLEDQIGSSCVRLNTNGTVIDKEEYYPFGDSSLRTFTKKRYRYVGKEKDLESGLYYYGARYYAAWTCRFISIDPLAHDYPFYTPYNYAGNKPINKIDIDGMQEGEAKTEPKILKTAEELVTISPDFANKPIEPQINKVKEIKKKDYSSKEEYQNSKSNSKKEWGAYYDNLSKYNFLQSARNEIINAKEGSLINEAKRQIVDKQVPVMLTLGDSGSHAFAHTDFHYNSNKNNHSLDRIEMTFDWDDINNLNKIDSEVSASLNVEYKKAIWKDPNNKNLGIETLVKLEELIVPTRNSTIWHEFGHIEDKLSKIKDPKNIEENLYNTLLQKNEQRAQEFERTILKKQYGLY